MNIRYTDASLIVPSIHLTDKRNKVDNYSHDGINRSRRRSFEAEEEDIYTTKVTIEWMYNKKEYNERRVAEEGADRVSRESQTRMGHCVV